MKILYVTDLHGDKNKYRKSLEIALNSYKYHRYFLEICFQNWEKDIQNNRYLSKDF